jgi:hypothetical protein
VGFVRLDEKEGLTEKIPERLSARISWGRLKYTGILGREMAGQDDGSSPAYVHAAQAAESPIPFCD